MAWKHFELSIYLSCQESTACNAFQPHLGAIIACCICSDQLAYATEIMRDYLHAFAPFLWLVCGSSAEWVGQSDTSCAHAQMQAFSARGKDVGHRTLWHIDGKPPLMTMAARLPSGIYSNASRHQIHAWLLSFWEGLDPWQVAAKARSPTTKAHAPTARLAQRLDAQPCSPQALRSGSCAAARVVVCLL